MITRNKQCTVQPVTVCTDAVTVLFKDHTVFIEAVGEDAVRVVVDGESILTFPYRESWLALEQPDPKQVKRCVDWSFFFFLRLLIFTSVTDSIFGRTLPILFYSLLCYLHRYSFISFLLFQSLVCG